MKQKHDVEYFSLIKMSKEKSDLMKVSKKAIKKEIKKEHKEHKKEIKIER